MTHFSEEELNRIARLSGLSLSDEEKEILHRDLMRIVPYMERITGLDTSAVDEDLTGAIEIGPGADSSDGVMQLRDDEDMASPIAPDITALSASAKDGTFTVPRAVE